MDAVIKQFESEGYKLVEEQNTKDDEEKEKDIKPITKKDEAVVTFQKDQHLPHCLLVFPPHVDLHAHKLLTDGHIILQDKVSLRLYNCF